MQISLFEKNYDYISVDSNNRVHIFVPLTAGSEIGTDNTCKASLEFVTFQGEIKNVLSQYIKDLERDIEILSLTADLQIDLKRKKEERLSQVKKYQRLFNEDLLYDHENLLRQLLASSLFSPSNGCSILLSPERRDNYLGFEPHLFSLSRQRDGDRDDNFYIRTEEVFERLLIKISETLCNDITVELFKKVKEKVSEITHINNDVDLTKVKKAFNEVINEYYKDLSFNESTDQKNTHSNYDYFTNMICVVNENDAIDNWLPYILYAGTDPDMLNAFVAAHNASPFINLRLPSGLDKFSCCIQFFLGFLNVYYYEKTGINRNFGKLIETPSIFNDLMGKLESDVMKGIFPEDSIISFINERSGNNGAFFSHPLTKDEIISIKKRFISLWRTIKDSHEYDEFLFYLPNKKGKFFNHFNRISIHASEFIYQQKFSLFNSFFGGQEALSIEPSSPERIETIKITLPIASLNTDFIAKLILNDDEKNPTYLKDSSFIREIKERSDYFQILKSISYNHHQLLKYFGIVDSYVLDPVLISRLCTITPTHLSGFARLKAALTQLDIPYKEITVDEKGEYILHFNEEAFYAIRKLLDYETQNTLSVSQAQLQTQILENMNLNALGTQEIQNAIKQKLETKFNHPAANIEVVSQNAAYQIRSDIKTIHRISQLAIASLTVSLEEDQVEELLICAGVKQVPEKTRESIEKALKKLKIPYQMVSKDDSSWKITANTEEAKTKITSLTNRDNIQKQQEARTNAAKMRVQRIKEALFVIGVGCFFALVVAGLFFPPLLLGTVPLIPLAFATTPLIVGTLVAGGFGAGVILSGIVLGCKKLFNHFTKKPAKVPAQEVNRAEQPILAPIIPPARPANLLDPLLLEDAKHIALAFSRSLPGAEQMDLSSKSYIEILNTIKGGLQNRESSVQLRLAKEFYMQSPNADRPKCFVMLRNVLAPQVFARFFAMTNNLKEEEKKKVVLDGGSKLADLSSPEGPQVVLESENIPQY